MVQIAILGGPPDSVAEAFRALHVASGTGRQLQTAEEHVARTEAIRDGGAMGDAGRRLAFGADDREAGGEMDLQAGSHALRRSYRARGGNCGGVKTRKRPLGGTRAALPRISGSLD